MTTDLEGRVRKLVLTIIIVLLTIPGMSYYIENSFKFAKNAVMSLVVVFFFFSELCLIFKSWKKKYRNGSRLQIRINLKLNVLEAIKKLKLV